MAQYFVPSPVLGTPIALAANQNIKKQLPLQADKSIVVLQILTANNAFVTFGPTLASLTATDGIKLTAGDVYSMEYNINSTWCMVYTTGAGSLCTGVAYVNGQPTL